MAWRRSGDKPLSEPMMVDSPTHICVTQPQWVKPGPVCDSVAHMLLTCCCTSVNRDKENMCTLCVCYSMGLWNWYMWYWNDYILFLCTYVCVGILVSPGKDNLSPFDSKSLTCTRAQLKFKKKKKNERKINRYCRQSWWWTNSRSDVKRVECSLLLGTGYHVYNFFLVWSLKCFMGVWAGIQPAGDWVPETARFESWSHQRKIADLLLLISNHFPVPGHNQTTNTGLIFLMCPANEGWRYIVTLSLIGWTPSQIDLCMDVYM